MLVILPTYNEAGNIVALCERVLALPNPVDLLLVDDASPDGTAALVRPLAAQYPRRLHIEARHHRYGRGDAVMHGFRVALAHRYDFCIEMDADFSHDPADIPRLLAAATHADLVIGSRNLPGGGVRGWNWKRRALHTMASAYARLLLGDIATDHTNGFRCYRVAALLHIPLESAMAQGFVGQTLRAWLCHRQGLRLAEIPTIFHERRAGHSKMSLREAVDGAWQLLRYRITEGQRR